MDSLIRMLKGKLSEEFSRGEQDGEGEATIPVQQRSVNTWESSGAGYPLVGCSKLRDQALVSVISCS